jgi:hypothetical protein
MTSKGSRVFHRWWQSPEVARHKSGDTRARCRYNAPLAARILSRKALAISINWDFFGRPEFFKRPIDGLNRIVEMTRLAILFEQGAVNDGEIVLGDGPLEPHALAGQFLGGFAMGFDGLCEPRRAALARAEVLKRGAEIILGRGPLERHALAGQLLQGFAIGFDGRLEPRRAGLPLAKRFKRGAETYLGRGPIERRALAGIFLQRVAIGFDGLLEPRRPALPLAEHSKRIAEIHLGGGPIERRPRATTSRKAATASSSRAVPLSRSPSLASALPRFIWVAAQSSGARSRVYSFKASR